VNAISTKFSIANSEQKIIEFLERISFSSPIILGGGTNILFKNNIDTNIIKIEIKGITITSETSKHIDISVGAGEKWDDLVNWSIQRNYGGLENLSLIPGNVGSAPIQNIGAYGVELKDCFLRCRAVSVKSGTIKIFNNNECDFSYRSSIFKKDLKNKYIISNVSFRLSKKNHKINLSYEPLKKHIINKNISEPTIKDISNSVIEIRNSKLPDPKIIGNCGSFFKNPIISLIDFKKLNETQNNVPFFNVSPDKVKVPAA
jgi:UDP-N-acetylmuramate dehydrogenase